MNFQGQVLKRFTENGRSRRPRKKTPPSSNPGGAYPGRRRPGTAARRPGPPLPVLAPGGPRAPPGADAWSGQTERRFRAWSDKRGEGGAKGRGQAGLGRGRAGSERSPLRGGRGLALPRKTPLAAVICN